MTDFVHVEKRNSQSEYGFLVQYIDSKGKGTLLVTYCTHTYNTVHSEIKLSFWAISFFLNWWAATYRAALQMYSFRQEHWLEINLEHTLLMVRECELQVCITEAESPTAADGIFPPSE